MSELEILGAQVLVAERARQAAKALRGKRGAVVCESVTEEQRFADCWRTENPVISWCASCVKHERIHEEYTAAVNRQRVERMKLTRMAMRIVSLHAEEEK